MSFVCGAKSGDFPSTAGVQLSLEKDSPIYHEGDRADQWYEVLSGITRTCRYLVNGQRHITAFYFPGDVFGLDDGVYQESSESVTDVVLRRQANTVPDQVLVKAWKKARENIFLIGHRSAANRVAAFILAIAERCKTTQLELPMSRSDIADYLNLTLHTVSRTICDLARRRLIALDDPQHLRILDAAALRCVAGDGDEEPTMLAALDSGWRVG